MPLDWRELGRDPGADGTGTRTLPGRPGNTDVDASHFKDTKRGGTIHVRVAGPAALRGRCACVHTCVEVSPVFVSLRNYLISRSHWTRRCWDACGPHAQRCAPRRATGWRPPRPALRRSGAGSGSEEACLRKGETHASALRHNASRRAGCQRRQNKVRMHGDLHPAELPTCQ